MSGSGYFANAGVYLVNIIFGLYILAVMLRFLLQIVRADFYNPICQFLITVTNPVLKSLRRITPQHMKVDWSSILLLVLLQFTEICLIALLLSGHIPSPASILVIIIAKLLQLLISIYIAVIIIQAIVSWISPGNYSPFSVLLYQLSEPLARPIRRYIPAAGGIDWSSFVVLILLNLSFRLIIAPLNDLSIYLSG